jgi:hypothetical protein
MLLVAGLLLGAGLALAGWDAGRAALVWLGGAGSVVTLSRSRAPGRPRGARHGRCVLRGAGGRSRPAERAHLARIAGVVLLLLQVAFLYLGAMIAVADLHPHWAGDDGVVLGPLMRTTVVAGVAATLDGFAGPADLRSERFLRPAIRPMYQGWDSWAAAGPRPVNDPAPAGGYTVPLG